MKKSKNINGFFFGKAEYRIEDNVGNCVVMKINYKDNDYDLVVMKKNSDGLNKLKKEAGDIAKDLIKRKSKVNFAKNNC